MIVQIQIDKYFCDKYHGDIYIESESFCVERQYPWQPWILLEPYGIGYEPGDEFDLCPVKIGQQQKIGFGDGYSIVTASEVS